MAEYIERDALRDRMESVDWYHVSESGVLVHGATSDMESYLPTKEVYRVICEATAADVVEVVSGYREGDVCIYGFGHENKSRAVVEIVRILNDERGTAEVKFLKVFVDDTGNWLFNYLLRSEKTMNASFRYLKNITPRMDGDA